MDALEFLKEERRMFDSFGAGYVKCPLGDTICQRKRRRSK